MVKYQVDPKKLNPKKYDHAMQMALKAVEKENPKKALKYFTTLLEMAPWVANGWLNRGIALSKLDRDQEAISHFERAQKLDPDEGSSWLYMGFCLTELGKIKEALEQFIMFEEKQPDCALLAWRNQACALMELSRFEDALVIYKKIEEQEEDEENLMLQGRCFRFLERFDEAADAYDCGLAIDPENPWIRFEYGLLFEARDNSDAAIAQYRRALSFKPDFFEVWWQLSGLFLDAGRNEECLSCCEQARKLDPKNPHVWLRQGLTLVNMEMPEQAWPFCLRSIRLKPKKNSDAWLLRAHIQVAYFAQRYSEQKFKRAFKHWKRAMESIPHVDPMDWHETFEPQLRHFAAMLEPPLIQRMIAESGLGQALFSATAVAVRQLVDGDKGQLDALTPPQKQEVQDALGEIHRLKEQKDVARSDHD